MKVYLFNNPQDVTVQELERDLAMLPQWRREVVMRYRFHADRVLSARAFLLLQQALREVWGIDEEIRFDINEHGKPSIVGHPEVHFNLSHCKMGVLCVVDNHLVGCDIEGITTELNMDLCRYAMNPHEVEQITAAEKPCVEFTRLWTMKEAVVKLTGQGLTTPLHDILTAAPHVHLDTHVDEEQGYVYTIATNSHRGTENTETK